MLCLCRACVYIRVCGPVYLCERGSKRLMPTIFYSLPPYLILLNITKYNKTKTITLESLELKETSKQKQTSPRRCENQSHLFVISLDSWRPMSEELCWGGLPICFFCFSCEGMEIPHEALTPVLPQHTGRRKGYHVFNLQVLMVGLSRLQQGCLNICLNLFSLLSFQSKVGSPSPWL